MNLFSFFLLSFLQLLFMYVIVVLLLNERKIIYTYICCLISCIIITIVITLFSITCCKLFVVFSHIKYKITTNNSARVPTDTDYDQFQLFYSYYYYYYYYIHILLFTHYDGYCAILYCKIKKRILLHLLSINNNNNQIFATWKIREKIISKR